jgi:plastocyanin
MTPIRPVRTRRARVLAALLATSAAALVALAPFAAAEPGAPAHPPAAAPAQQPAPQNVAVPIRNYAFSPPDLMVNVGDTVTWTNTDDAPHNVMSTDGPASFGSDTLQKGATFSYTFTTPGTYKYVCTFHPGMSASVTAMAVAPPPPGGTAPAEAAPPPREAAAPPPAPAAAPGGAPAGPAPAAPAPAAAAANAPAQGGTQVATAARQGPTLDPLLLVAGVALGVATLCLLLVGTQPSDRP